MSKLPWRCPYDSTELRAEEAPGHHYIWKCPMCGRKFTYFRGEAIGHGKNAVRNT